MRYDQHYTQNTSESYGSSTMDQVSVSN